VKGGEKAGEGDPREIRAGLAERILERFPPGRDQPDENQECDEEEEQGKAPAEQVRCPQGSRRTWYLDWCRCEFS
jgi:hypothetical protein